MTNPVLLAVDAGTTRMKAALMDATGRVVTLESLDVNVMHPFEGASEVDMQGFWETFCQLTQKLAAANPTLWTQLSGMCISGQGDGCWPVNAAGQPVRNAMLWNDTRTRSLTLAAAGAVEELCIEHHLTPLFPGAAPLQALWLKQKEPHNYAQLRWILHCKDWLNFRLTGRATTDASDASTALLNVHTLQYDPELLGLLDIPESAQCFPPLLNAGSRIGPVSAEAAAQSGLPEGLAVWMGGIDIAVAATGAGVNNPGEALTIVGTTLCNEVVIDASQVNHRDTRGSALRHVNPRAFLRVMATSSGTSSIDWARQLLMPGKSFAEIEAGVTAVAPGSEGVLFQPYLYGERAPFRNPLACGGFYGISARHTGMHLMRAVYEGIGMMLVDCYQALPPVRQVVVAGGGASSDVLCQILADCLGKPVLRKGIAELGLHGAYRLMCAGLGLRVEITVGELEQDSLFEPDPERHRLYQALYPVFSQLRFALEPYWSTREKNFSAQPFEDLLLEDEG